jgi:hypothetical protein
MELLAETLICALAVIGLFCLVFMAAGGFIAQGPYGQSPVFVVLPAEALNSWQNSLKGLLPCAGFL